MKKLKRLGGSELLTISSKIVSPYIYDSLENQISEKMSEIVKKLAKEIIRKYDIESMFTSEAKNEFDNEDLILTVVLRKKHE